MAMGITLRARIVIIHPLYGCIITDLSCLTFKVNQMLMKIALSEFSEN